MRTCFAVCAAMRPKDERAADDFYLRTFAEPSIDVNGIATGSPVLLKTVVPVEAVANVSMRLAPGQRVDEVVPVVERLLRESAPAGAEPSHQPTTAGSPGGSSTASALSVIGTTRASSPTLAATTRRGAAAGRSAYRGPV